MEELKLTSPAFEAGGWIPDSNSGFGEDISPELHLENMDEKAVSLAITLDDLSHPLFPGFNHWVAWNITPLNVIPAHLPKGERIERPIHAEQGSAYGRHCYRGPKPPLNWNHEYCFTVYVLDKMLSLDGNSKKKDLLSAIEGHVLQIGRLNGKYQRKHT